MGDARPEVLEVQRMLTDLGYAVAHADGNFDTSTLRAVIGFQSDRSLPVDGVVAVNTWTALKKYAGSHEEPREAQQEDGGHTSGCERETPPRMEGPALAPLEAPTPYMLPMPAQKQQAVTQVEAPPTMPEPSPAPPRAFAVPTVPLIVWKAIGEKLVPHTAEPIQPVVEPEIPVAEPVEELRGWTPVQA